MKAKKKVKSVKLNEKGEKVRKTDVKYGVNDILLKVEEFVSELKYDLAYKFCTRALELEPQNELALCATAEVMLELGKVQDAKEHFGKAIKSSPEVGYTKYLHMGQLCEGQESLCMYETGLQLMLQLKSKKSVGEEGAEEPDVSPRDISEVYVAMAELYLTDLCEDENAQEKCEDLLKKAIDSDSSNSYALQTMASFLLSCNKREEAIKFLKQSLDLWLPAMQAALSDAADGEGTSELILECDLDFEKRKACTRLLLETELFEKADAVLDILCAELDSDPEVWYLSGLRHFLAGSEQFEQATAYFEQSLEIAGDEPVHKEMCVHMSTLLDEIRSGCNGESDQRMDDT